MSTKPRLRDENEMAAGVVAGILDGNGEDIVPQEQAPIPRPALIKKYYASIYQKDPKKELPEKFVTSIQQLEEKLEMPLWMLIQQNRDGEQFSDIGWDLYKAFFEQRHSIALGKPVALLLESGGGHAALAFKIARLFQRRANQFVVIIPSYAKSAATLMVLAGTSVIMGRDAELGPL